MTYPDSVHFLYALGNEMKTAKLGLERITTLLAAMGNPERAYKVVHVAGTNGKGSVCSMMEAGLRSAGVRTGLFISPHLIEPTERIQVNGIPVTQEQFSRAFNVVHEKAGALNLDCHPTYFETVTAMAFWLFRELAVETAVVETGLGGRLDSTNVVRPALTVITSVDYDHQAWLGDRIEQIAAEKAGILKAGVPAVFSAQRDDVRKILDQHARALGIRVTENVELRDLTTDARGSRFQIKLKNGWQDVHCPLAGDHQVENAAAAALALDELDVLVEGIADARWPGRLEHISPNPDILLDGAHNPAGARALARYLEKYYATRKRWMIFGAMRDKDVAEIAGILFSLGHQLIFTAPAMARAMPPEELKTLAGCGRTASNIAAALKIITDEASDEDVVVVTGSLYLVGEARRIFADSGATRRALYNKNSWVF